VRNEEKNLIRFLRAYRAEWVFLGEGERCGEQAAFIRCCRRSAAQKKKKKRKKEKTIKGEGTKLAKKERRIKKESTSHKPYQAFPDEKVVFADGPREQSFRCTHGHL
jgi:hypothetical protein